MTTLLSLGEGNDCLAFSLLKELRATGITAAPFWGNSGLLPFPICV